LPAQLINNYFVPRCAFSQSLATYILSISNVTNTVSHNKSLTEAYLRMIQANEGIIHKICGIYGLTPDDRKDLFQEIVLQAWKAYPRYNAQAKPSTWLYRIALNTAISDRRRQGARPSTVADESVLTNVPQPHSGEDPGQALQAIIGRLPAVDKALVFLYLEERPYDEIAEIMGISASNVSTRLGRIRERMRSMAKQGEG
jgi:RNA polymerase sigma-70 factor (ECF subfamily)